MKLLIDTQVFIWLINEDDRLGASTLKALQDTANQVCISYFSFFEMTIKASIGKLDFDSSIVDDLPKMGVELLMPSDITLRKYATFNASNKDPFDNILMAVAISEKYTLVTADPKILAATSPGLKLRDATQ